METSRPEEPLKKVEAPETALLQYILNRVLLIYCEEIAKIFKYVIIAPFLMSVLVYHFFNRIEEDPTFILKDG